jgi:hypothetical protein
MREPDLDPQRMHTSPPQVHWPQVRWPQWIADHFRGNRILPFLSSAVFIPLSALNQEPLWSFIASIYAYAVAFALMMTMEVMFGRAGRRPRGGFFRNGIALVCLPIFVGSWALTLAVAAFRLPSLPWEARIDLQFSYTTLACAVILTIVVSCLLIVIARHTTSYIVPTSPPAE